MMTSDEYVEYINTKNVDIRYTSYIVGGRKKRVRVRCINNYHCITDYCRFTSRNANGYMRRDEFKEYVSTIKSDIPLFYTQLNDSKILIGTWVSKLLLDHFLAWLER